MNWIGGSRARAQVQEPFNRGPRNQRRNSNVLLDGDDSSITSPGINDEFNDNNPSSQENPGRNEGPSRPKRARGSREFLPEWKKKVDYEALGFKLVEREPVQRRVVPLLEFAEKTFPTFGHILSLQLSHQMDITKTPPIQATPTEPGNQAMGNGQELNPQPTPSSFGAEGQHEDMEGSSSRSSGSDEDSISTTICSSASNTTTTTGF